MSIVCGGVYAVQHQHFERERELATIKVLGFRRGEVHHYVNKETLDFDGDWCRAGRSTG